MRTRRPRPTSTAIRKESVMKHFHHVSYVVAALVGVVALLAPGTARAAWPATACASSSNWGTDDPDGVECDPTGTFESASGTYGDSACPDTWAVGFEEPV